MILGEGKAPPRQGDSDPFEQSIAPYKRASSIHSIQIDQYWQVMMTTNLLDRLLKLTICMKILILPSPMTHTRVNLCQYANFSSVYSIPLSIMGAASSRSWSNLMVMISYSSPLYKKRGRDLLVSSISGEVTKLKLLTFSPLFCCCQKLWLI